MSNKDDVARLRSILVCCSLAACFGEGTLTLSSSSRLPLNCPSKELAISVTPPADVFLIMDDSYPNVMTRAFGSISGRRSLSHMVERRIADTEVQVLRGFPLRPWTATMLHNTFQVSPISTYIGR